MNRATIARAPLRALADALQQFRDRTAAAEIGRRLDMSTSTVSRDRRDLPLEAWSFADVIELVRTDELLRHAVLAHLDGGATQCDPRALATDLAREVQATADLHSAIMTAQSDGKLDPRERALIRQRVLERQSTDAALLADFAAMDAREGVRV